MAVTRFGDVTFAFDDHALQAMLAGPNGDVARDLTRRAIRIETQAKINATGQAYGGFSGARALSILSYVGERGPRVRTGRLRASITWQLGQDEQGLYVDIGTNVPYGRYLELGLLPNGKRYPFLGPAIPAGLT